MSSASAATSVAKTVVEGAAKITLPGAGQVFYNPVQIFNRDLSVCVINQYCASFPLDQPKRKERPAEKKRTLLEALSATGLRAVRYAKECPAVDRIVANDIDPEAAKLIERNIADNDCSTRVLASCGDANLVALRSLSEGTAFDIIDLDPYGSAAPFLDAAVQSISDGGLLCVTCTDMAALCASYPDACFFKYGAVAVKGEVCHEFAVRIILNSIARAAAKFKRGIQPLLSCSIDFYGRVFVRIRDAPKCLRQTPFSTAMLHRCPDCHYFAVQPVCRDLSKNESSYRIGPAPLVSSASCPFCSGHMQLAGPFWSGPLHDPVFVNQLRSMELPESITTGPRMLGLLAVCAEEAELPKEAGVLYYAVNEMAHHLRSPSPPLSKFMYAVKNAGYSLAIPHCAPTALKTDAPFSFLLSTLKGYILEEHPTAYKFDDGTDSIRTRIWRALSSIKVDHKVSFEKNDSAIPKSKLESAVRFPQNPEKNWGPKPRARPPKQPRIESTN